MNMNAQRRYSRTKGDNDMDTLAYGNHPRTETEIPTDLLAGLLMDLGSGTKPVTRQPEKLTLKICCVMAATTLLTFATLASGYQLLFSHQLFA